jgi:hypothetical protein
MKTNTSVQPNSTISPRCIDGEVEERRLEGEVDGAFHAIFLYSMHDWHWISHWYYDFAGFSGFLGI